MINVYCFTSKNQTNIWAGYGAKMWAVSDVSERDMEIRRSKSLNIPIGAFGLIYCSDGQFFTMPFKIASEIEWKMEEKVWPEPWAMPFKIEPLGSPGYRLSKQDAYRALDCLKGATSFTDVFFVGGTCAFTPSKIPDDDWQYILDDCGYDD